MDLLDDKTSIEDAHVADAIARSEELVIQYSKPIYSPKLLRQLDGLCRKHGDKLEIRFYGHGREGFDFSTLARLPHVQRLAVDCLGACSNLDALFDLPSLRHLSFGTRADVPGDFLAHQNLSELRSLKLGQARKPSIDLSPIAGFSSLERLTLEAHHRRIEVLGTLPCLRSLTLRQIKKAVRLDFVSQLSSLQTLRIVLGGRDHIHEIRHSGLRHLEIKRVRGFSEFRPHDFPGLRFLQITDQIHLPGLRFTNASQSLVELRLINCKTLVSLTGIQELAALEGLRIYETAIPLDALIAAGLPSALRVFGFYTETALDASIRKRLDGLGYREFGPIQPASAWNY